jgi:iron complex transport system substrate-binding protein
MKKTIVISAIMVFVIVCMTFCGSVSAEETRVFTDDAGRVISLPVTIDAVSPAGALAQIMLYTLEPDLFVSVANVFTEEEKKYVDSRLLTLPVTGQFYGSKSTMNAEEIMELNKSLGIDVILDVGEVKSSVKEDLDTIQSQTGVSFAFITQNNLSDIPASYITLGNLLGIPKRGQELAGYTKTLLAEFASGMEKVGDNKVSLIYVSIVDGNSVNLIGSGDNSYHGEVINYLGNNLAPEAVTASGRGDAYTMEDIIQMNPEYILVTYTKDHAYYNEIMNSSLWATLPAVQNGKVYEAPCGPYNWMGNPPSVQRLLSMMWLGNLFYPDVFDYNINDRVKEYYSLFFGYDLTDAELNNIMIYAKNASSSSPSSAAPSPFPLGGILAGLGVAALFAVIIRNQ